MADKKRKPGDSSGTKVADGEAPPFKSKKIPPVQLSSTAKKKAADIRKGSKSTKPTRKEGITVGGDKKKAATTDPTEPVYSEAEKRTRQAAATVGSQAITENARTGNRPAKVERRNRRGRVVGMKRLGISGTHQNRQDWEKGKGGAMERKIAATKDPEEKMALARELQAFETNRKKQGTPAADAYALRGKDYTRSNSKRMDKAEVNEGVKNRRFVRKSKGDTARKILAAQNNVRSDKSARDKALVARAESSPEGKKAIADNRSERRAAALASAGENLKKADKTLADIKAIKEKPKVAAKANRTPDYPKPLPLSKPLETKNDRRIAANAKEPLGTKVDRPPARQKSKGEAEFDAVARSFKSDPFLPKVGKAIASVARFANDPFGKTAIKAGNALPKVAAKINKARKTPLIASY